MGNKKSTTRDLKKYDDDDDVDNVSERDASGRPLRKRETWSTRFDFLLACIGFSVGLGNVWRFPYLCYKNGGGAFLLPYFICVIIGGIPLFYLEVAVGQFMSVGGLRAWNICPILQGIGIATTVTVFILNSYYNIILTWTLYYFFASFTSVLPWTKCGDPEWTTDKCTTDFSISPDPCKFNKTHPWDNETLYSDLLAESKSDNVTEVGIQLDNCTTRIMETYSWASNFTHFVDAISANDSNITWTGEKIQLHPVTEYWENKVLGISDSIEDMGIVKWDLALCLLLAWILVYVCICKGIRSSGKVMYVTATAPYIFMVALLVRGVTLDGAKDGIIFYLKPNITKLAETEVWVDAGTQIFFSYSIALGSLTALGSYNKFKHNSYRDAIIFACTNSGTSLLAGFVIFSVLGHMALEQGVDIREVAESGPGLTFVAYPRALGEMPGAPAWSVLFFLMVILLGLDSQFVGVEGVVTAVVDQWPQYLRVGYRREIFIAIVCVLTFFVGLPMCMNGGMYVFQLFDHYGGSKIILLVAFFECVGVAWIYGIGRFYDNIKMMIGHRIWPYMFVCWLVLSPVFCLVIFGLAIKDYSELTYKRPGSVVYVYPDWAVGVGWGLACIAIIFIPIVAIFKIIKYSFHAPICKVLQLLLKPAGLKPHQLRPEDVGEESIDDIYRKTDHSVVYNREGGTAVYRYQDPDKGLANAGFKMEKR